MTKKSINFKQERDFGDLFNATFSFISLEFKLLATAILYFVVPLLLLAAIAMTIYSVKAQEMMQTFVQDVADPLAIFKVMGALSGYFGVAMVLSLFAFAMIISIVYGYIKLYIKNGPDGFTINDIWGQVSKNFLRLFVAAFIIGLVVLVGFVFCVIPGIYLGVALSIVLCIMIFEEKDFSSAFGRSIKLINKNWWMTFAVLLIVTIIMYVLMIFISIPSMIFGFKSLFMNMKAGQPLTMDFSMGYYITNTLTQILTQVLAVIPVVLTAFIYYSIVEKVEKPSLMDKIDQINNNE
jgi:hypothetical protein